MFTLSRTRIMKRSLLALVSSIAIIAGAFIAAKNIKLFQVNAANSDTVQVSQGDWVYWKENSGLGTPRLFISPGNYLAYCIDPAIAPPYENYDYARSSMDNNMIKLAIYISSVHNDMTNNIMKNWFSEDNIDPYWKNTSSPYPNINTEEGLDNFEYVFMHIVVGHINHNDNEDIKNRINTYLSSQDKTLLKTIENSLSNYISDENGRESDVWLMAKNYTLYNIVVPTNQNVQNIVWIENNPDSGSIKVQKCDEETESCPTTQGKASLAGIKFEVYNASGSRIYVPSKNQFYNNNALIASGTTGADGSVTFSGLPLDVKYRVKEASTNNSYLLTASEQKTTITVNGTTENLNFSDDVVRGDLKFTKTSDVDGEPMDNVVFKIKSTSGAKEEHLVVTDEDGIVDTSASHALHSFHTNGYDDMEEDEIEYLAYGTWFGAANAVDDDRGALPYDTYEITELKCDANKFCYDIGDTKKTVTIKTDGEVVDLGEWSNDCAEFSITTTATDNADGDKIVAFNEDIEIKDVVDYCLKKDMEFTIKGVVMNKNTKEPVMVDGKRVEQVITFTPESTCGTTEMIYSLNTKDLGGTDLVIFEELYYGDELILSHSDFDNASQTVSVAPPPPDTGAITKTANGGILSNNAMIIVFAIGGSLGLYASARALSRKRFLNK